MKKIIIGTIVAAVIYFLYQTAAWMGGLHGTPGTYTPKGGEILNYLSQSLGEEGLYMMPMVDPSQPNYKEEEQKLHEQNIGKPWAMVFYHKSMMGMEAGYILIGFLYSLIACLIASMIVYYGNFSSFGTRFLAAFSFGLFTLSQGVLDDMNWWSYPWSFVKAEVIDLTLGWAITSLWLAWFVKKKSKTA
ncbi:MAG: hypothetical protein L0Y79_07930 [Chlorobi bacterium]|nr:hypothetical protein [Chlorobiota bacterium]MCI0716283.1 hypothetical protein [Chlorobiota bacterium]